MRIGVIGAGRLGGTVAKAWVGVGHEVMFSSRHPGKFADVVEELGPTASAGTTREAAEHGEVVLIAVPYRALEGIDDELGDALSGGILVDASNPNKGAGDPPDMVDAAQEKGVALASADRLPNLRLVRGFSSVDATKIEASSKGRRAEPLGVPIAGDDDAALEVVAGLVRDAGCAPVIVGGLADARGFQRGGPAFRKHVGEAELRRLLDI